MTSKMLQDIKSLRERREQRALAELQTRNRMRDSANEASTRAQQQAAQEQVKMHREESTKYQEISGAEMSAQEISELLYSIEHGRTHVSVLKNRGRQLQIVARKATSDANDAKVEHSLRFKAQRKWSKIVDDTVSNDQVYEDRAQELANEDLSLLAKRNA